MSNILRLRGGAGNVHHITSMSNLDHFIGTSAGKLVVIDFTASWCGPCQRIAPIYAQLSEKYPNVIFTKVDVDECPDISEKYDINCMPTFIFVKNGNKVAKMEGADPAGVEKNVQQHA